MSVALLIVAATLAADGSCYLPTEQTAGWKRVDVPEDMPALAAPADIDQFRSGEPAWLVEQDPQAYQRASEHGRGSMDYAFKTALNTRRLSVRFMHPLRGAKVDAWANGKFGQFPLLAGRRVADAEVELEWDLPDIDMVVIRVHHHLRPTPVVTHWKTARWVDLASDPSVPARFRVTRSLYFRHPGGRTLQLCDLPGQALSVQRTQLAGNISSVMLARPMP